MSVRLDFLGAAGTVTGSKTLLNIGKQKHLIDCGLFQGPKSLRNRNWEPFHPKPASLDSVILTHAHLDHSGYLPRLAKEGFKGPVYSSRGTHELCQILLMDAAHLQEEDANYANQSKYSNHDPAIALFDTEDTEKALTLFRPHPREEWFPIGDQINLRFLRSGHIIGSSFVQIALQDAGKPRLITFTGDIGHDRSKTLKGPAQLPETDVLVIEATYGNRLHPRGDVLDELAKVVLKTAHRKGVLIIPAFSVGRSQEILYLFRLLEDQNKIPKIPVLLDSPMSNAATGIFLNNLEDSKIPSSAFGEIDSFFPALFESIEARDDSMMACMRDGPLVVISAAGMLTGGRILHHLKKRLPQPENTVLFVGFQAEGSKGRFLQEQAKINGSLRIHHQEIPVEAEIETLTDLSAHGDAQDILDWIGKIEKKPTQVFVNHGSVESCQALAAKITQEYGIPAEAMTSEKSVTLWAEGGR